MKRRPLTIMEVLIAFGLLALITAFIMTSLHNAVILKKQSEEITQIVLERKMVQERLSQLFSRLTKTENSFYTEAREEGPILAFTYDNGIDFDPAFCHEVKGALFQRESSLVLRKESIEKEGCAREEVLLTHCKTLSYKFLTFGEKSEIQKSWSKEQRDLPYLMSIEIIPDREGEDKEPLIYTFFLPSNHPEGIVYR